MDPEQSSFELRAKHLLEMLGFHIEPFATRRKSSPYLLARKMDGPIATDFVVAFDNNLSFSRKGRITQFAKFLKRISKATPSVRGLVISRLEPKLDATASSKRLGIEYLSLATLSESLVDFSKYLGFLVSDFESLRSGTNTRLTETYTWQDVQVDKKSVPERLEFLVENWMNSPSQSILVLLGSTGIGKTTFTRKFAYDLAQRHVHDPKAPIPLRIELRGQGGFQKFDVMLANHLAENGIIASLAVVNYMISEGKILVILDGFDEMRLSADRMENLFALKALVHPIEGSQKAKMILTCRTNYFKDDEAVRAWLSGDELQVARSSSGTDLYRELSGKPNYLLCYLREFSAEQIEKFVRAVSGDKADQYLSLIKATYNLQELAGRPLLLEMIVKSLPLLMGKSKEITATDLYEAYTEEWIQRDDWRLRITKEGRAKLAEELAWQVFFLNRSSIHYSELPSYIENYYKEKIRTQRELEIADTEVRAASFLTRDPLGNYGFVHKSFMEFFCAKLFAEEIEKKECYRLGDKLLSPEIMSFLKVMVKSDRPLVDILLSTKKPAGPRAEYHLEYLGANCMMLLQAGGWLPVADNLSGTIMRHAQLGGADLSDMKLARVDLNDSVLTNANLDLADLEGATLRGADLRQASLKAAFLGGADLTGADLRDAKVDGTDL